MDVFLVAIIAHILLSHGPRPLAYSFLGWSLSLILGSDIGYAIMALNETYSTGSFVDCDLLSTEAASFSGNLALRQG